MKRGVVLGKALKDAEADKKEPGDIIWTMFRCLDMQCNKLLTVEDKKQGFCSNCQGIKFGVARYLTEDEKAQIDAGTLHPVQVNCDEIGAEPPAPREVR